MQVKDHVLLPQAKEIETAGKELKSFLTPDRIQHIISLIPDEWLVTGDYPDTPEQIKNTYLEFLKTRIAHSEIFEKEAQHAGKLFI